MKAIVVLLIKFKRITVETSGSGDITGNVVFRPALLELTFFLGDGSIDLDNLRLKDTLPVPEIGQKK